MLVSELTTNRIPLSDAMTKVNARIRMDGGLDEIVKKLTKLDKIVFTRIYQHQTLYSKTALDEYSNQLGRKVNKGSIQSVVNKLKKTGVITEADNKFFIEKVGLFEILE
jgi:hypothetical protein